MEKWYEPDQTWTVFSVKHREDYVERYVVPGRFHADVPEDVVKAYETAEYLMALAWYHYPMYDEALKKLLAIFEIAIKLKCRQLGISLEYHTKNGHKRTYILKELINKICAHEPEKEMNGQLHHARGLRNNFAHPDRHSFMGGIAYQAIIPLINVLNLLFLSIASVQATKEHITQLKQQFGQFTEGLFVLEQGRQKYLVTSAEPLYACWSNGAWHSFWVFQPVLINVYEALSNHRYSPPISLALSNINLSDNTLTAANSQNQRPIKLIQTTQPQHLRLHTQHQQEWQQLTELNRQLYLRNQQQEPHKILSQFKYKHCWN